MDIKTRTEVHLDPVELKQALADHLNREVPTLTEDGEPLNFERQNIWLDERDGMVSARAIAVHKQEEV